MPRGNDTEGQKQALHELADEFSTGTAGNAEILIEANAALRTADLATIGGFPVDEEKTAELDLDDLEGPDGEYVVDAVVRTQGRVEGTVVVFADESGRLHKHLAESNLEEVRNAPALAAAGEGPRRASRSRGRASGDASEAKDKGSGGSGSSS
jgi:hypothetical protein